MLAHQCAIGGLQGMQVLIQPARPLALFVKAGTQCIDDGRLRIQSCSNVCQQRRIGLHHGHHWLQPRIKLPGSVRGVLRIRVFVQQWQKRPRHLACRVRAGPVMAHRRIQPSVNVCRHRRRGLQLQAKLMVDRTHLCTPILQHGGIPHHAARKTFTLLQ